MMNQSYSECGYKMKDFEMKITNPNLFEKISNDNILFVFLESAFNENTTEGRSLWMIPRSNKEDFKKVIKNSFKLKNVFFPFKYVKIFSN